MNNFLIDLKYSKQYEQYFAGILHGIWLDMTDDDHGIDIIKDGMLIDVKCYRKPRMIKHFKGVFIEYLLPLSGNKGWYLDENKATTHYIMLQDAEEGRVSYYKGWLISKEGLHKAIEEAEIDNALEDKSISSAAGVILPYEYLDKYCEMNLGGNYYGEQEN